MSKTLYKYKGIQNLKFFIDIIMKNRLYASKYVDLNDPMEGQYYYSKGELDKNILSKISSAKEDLRLCSLSRKRNNELMWSYYAEGHRGVVIGVTVDDHRYDVHAIKYTGLVYLTGAQIEHATPREILTHKLNVWSYEEEERVFVSNKFYINVQIDNLITGRAMSNRDFSFIKEIVERINPLISIVKANTFM